MKRHYDNVESIISATEEINWDALPVHAYKYDVGTYEKTSSEHWDEDRQCMRPYTNLWRSNEGDVGLIQQAFVAAARQSERTGEYVFRFYYHHFIMISPCDLDIDIQGARCRLLWGRIDISDHSPINIFKFDFVMCGRRFLVIAGRNYNYAYSPERNDGIEYLQVVLYRGEPFDSPIWGTQLETKLVEVPDQAENRTGAKGQG